MNFHQGSHKFDIENVTVVNTAMAHVHHQVEQSTTAEKIIAEHRAIEATHNATTAEYAPKCNPKTRLQVVGDLVRLVTADPETSKLMFWFNGPAGAGKTCIMRELVNRCEACSGTMVMSYFFSTRVHDLDHSKPFVATLAHQLMQMGVPGLKESILQAVSAHPSIFLEGLEFQTRELIVKPFRATRVLSPPLLRPRIVLVVDGLDECRDQAQRQHISSLLLSLTANLHPLLAVVVASRPELDIRTRFDSPKVALHIHTIQLHDYNGKDDVRIFYCDEFEEIRSSHPLRHYIPSTWPTEDTVQTLVDKSSGHFIYPATIMKYIAHNPRKSPVGILENVLALEITDDNPLAELDALYRAIAHPPDVDLILLKRLLHTINFIASLPQDFTFMSLELLDILFNLPQGTAESTFSNLHSVMNIRCWADSSSPKLRRLSFHHKSFEDFLRSPGRSQDLFQSESQISVDILSACARFYSETWAVGSPADPRHILFVFMETFFVSILTCWLRVHQPEDALPQVVLNLSARLTGMTYLHAPYDPLIRSFLWDRTKNTETFHPGGGHRLHVRISHHFSLIATPHKLSPDTIIVNIIGERCRGMFETLSVPHCAFDRVFVRLQRRSLRWRCFRAIAYTHCTQNRGAYHHGTYNS